MKSNIKILLAGLFAMFNAGFAYAMPSLAQAKQCVTTGIGLEGVRQSLYDNLLYPTAGVIQLSFFAQPLGQGLTTAVGAAANATKTIQDTNLELAGQLPSGKAFLMTSIEVPFYAGSVSTANTYTLASPVVFNATAAAALEAQLADVNTFYQSGSLLLFISSKQILQEAPIMRFPPKCGLKLQGAISLAGTNAQPAGFGSINMQSSGRPYMLEPQVYIEPSTNFSVTLNWPAVVATPSGFNARVGCIIDGYLYRTA